VSETTQGEPQQSSTTSSSSKKEEEPQIHPNSFIEFYKNGQPQGPAFTNIYQGTYYPAASLYMGATVRFNFGPHFKHPPPANVPYRTFLEIAAVARVEEEKRKEEERKRKEEEEKQRAEEERKRLEEERKKKEEEDKKRAEEENSSKQQQPQQADSVLLEPKPEEKTLPVAAQQSVVSGGEDMQIDS
jgi:hypothetical protein